MLQRAIMQCLIQLLFAEAALCAIEEQSAWWSAVAGVESMGWCIDRWICIERGGKCNARYSQAKAKPPLTHVLFSLFTIYGAAINEMMRTSTYCLITATTTVIYCLV